MRIDRLDRDDFEEVSIFHYLKFGENRIHFFKFLEFDNNNRFFFLKDNHKLIVENDEDEIEFIITISDSRNCDPTQNPGKEDEG